MKRPFPGWFAVTALVVLAAGRCASASKTAAARDRFPLDPREELAGPFDPAIQRGWRALLAGDAARAEQEFSGALDGSSKRAAEIGAIEAFVAGGRSNEALGRCADALPRGEPTLPLLVACGETEARAGETIGACLLYERAAARAPERPGLADRAQELHEAATQELLSQADEDASAGRFGEARVSVEQAIAWNPRSAFVLLRAAEVECAAGERERALQYSREALALGGLNLEARGRAGELALELGDYTLAVFAFDALAEEDEGFRDRASEARLAFRVANWPEAERKAARAPRITRAGAAGLVWWTFPEVRDARVTAGVVASDVLERADTRTMMRVVSLGLLDVDPERHRARPDAALTRPAAARLVLRLAAALGRFGAPPECLEGSSGSMSRASDAIRLAARCGLLSESGGPFVSGPELTRGLDRLRLLMRTGEDHEP